MSKRGPKPRAGPPAPRLATVLPHIYRQFRSAVARLGARRIAIDSPPHTLWMDPSALGAPVYRVTVGEVSKAVYRVRALELRTQVFDEVYWIGEERTGEAARYVDLGTESGARNWFELLAERLSNAT